MIKKSPKISVITIVYNDVHHIENTLKSVKNQSYSDFEWIIIDGASSDGTCEKIESYRDSIDVFVSEPDRGISDAFNKGVQKSSGQWLIFMNSGDCFYDTETLSLASTQLDLFEKFDVVYGQIQLTKDSGQILKNYGAPFDFKKFQRFNYLPHQAMFIQKSYFEKWGSYSLDLKIAMDYEHLLRSGSELKAQYIDVVCARTLAGGVSQSHYQKVLAEFKKVVLEHTNQSRLYIQIYYFFKLLKLQILHKIRK
jgi:glycosyltransferase involved in cell wall biosynthesis